MARYTKGYKGLYRTGVVIGYDEQGRQKRKWLSASTIAELDRKVAETKIALGAGSNLLDDDIRFREYAKVWFEWFEDDGVAHEYLLTEGYIWTGQYPAS